VTSFVLAVLTLSAFLALFALRARKPHRSASHTAARERRLRLEELEPIIAPANYLWYGQAADAAWGVAGNWIDLSTNQVSQNLPTDGDNLTFQSGRQVTDNNGNTLQGSGLTSTDDLNNKTFNNLTLLNADTIYLNGPLNLKNASLLADTIQSSQNVGPQTITIDPGTNDQGQPLTSLVSMAGMTFKADLVLKAGATTTITDAGTTYLFGKTDNYGTVNWNGGDLVISDNLTNYAGANFNVRYDNQLSRTLNSTAKVVNQGLFQKVLMSNNQTPQTLITTPFDNSGTVLAWVGTLNILGTLTQTGQNSQTAVYANATLKAPTFNLNAGTLWGAGDYYGDLTNNAWVHPGMNYGQAGTFTIHGTYTQGANGTLYVEVTGLGAAGVGTVNVVTNSDNNNAGGTATIQGGKFLLNRSARFTPGPMTVNFLSATTVTKAGPSGWQIDLTFNPWATWVDPNNNVRTFTAVNVGASSVNYVIC
jgi:hypothetical protein